MATLFSAVFLDVSGLSGGSSITVTPEAGHTWVVRCIDATAGGDLGQGGGELVVIVGSARIFTVPIYVAQGGRSYPWDGRQVLGAPDAIEVQTAGGMAWDIRISGYDFSS